MFSWIAGREKNAKNTNWKRSQRAEYENYPANTRTNAPNLSNTRTQLTYAKRDLKSEKVTEKLITCEMKR